MAKIDDALTILADPAVATLAKVKNAKGKLLDVAWAISVVVPYITRPTPAPSGRAGKLDFQDPDQSNLQ